MLPNVTTREVASGWVSEPNGRGTWSILSTCFLTILLCCWTSVCPNIPAEDDSVRNQFRDKFDLACMGLLGPEFLLMLVVGQWASARSSVKTFHADGFAEWTLTHAFFADMGGFRLKVDGLPRPIPLDAMQLHYLVVRGYLEYPKTRQEDIQDRDKAGGISRFIAICQASWFLINIIVRFCNGLCVTTLEVTALSFIAIFVATAYCWHWKPLDVSRAITLEATRNISIDYIRAQAKQESMAWRRSPLDFISRNEWLVSLFWRYYVQILRYLHIPLFSRPMRTQLWDRIPSDNFPRTDTMAEIVCTPILILFFSIFIVAWNFTFPTAVEQYLWRIASIYMLIFGIVGGIFCGCCDKWLLPNWRRERRFRLGLQSWRPERDQEGGNAVRRLAARLRNIHPDHDPELDVPLRVLIPLSVLCSGYCLCRTYIWVEDLIGLRKLPRSAFDTVSWSVYIPHW